MRKMQSLLNVPHVEPKTGKRIYFGQLLVETRCPLIVFAKEVANAMLMQAEKSGVPIGYTPNGDVFVTRVDGNEHALEFQGDTARYLGVSLDDAKSFHVSFREGTLKDRSETVVNQTDVVPDYVLTLSMVAVQPGEMGHGGFWIQLANHLFHMLASPGPEERQDNAPPRMTIVYGNGREHRLVLG